MSNRTNPSENRLRFAADGENAIASEPEIPAIQGLTQPPAVSCSCPVCAAFRALYAHDAKLIAYNGLRFLQAATLPPNATPVERAYTEAHGEGQIQPFRQKRSWRERNEAKKEERRQRLAQGVHDPGCPLWLGNPPDPSWRIVAEYAQEGPCPHLPTSQLGRGGVGADGTDFEAVEYDGPAIFDVSNVPLFDKNSVQQEPITCPRCHQPARELKAVAIQGRGRPRKGHISLRTEWCCATCAASKTRRNAPISLLQAREARHAVAA